MTHLLITLAHDPTVRPISTEIAKRMQTQAIDLYTAFLDDSITLATHISHATINLLAHQESLLPEYSRYSGEVGISNIPNMNQATLAQQVALALNTGPVLLFGGDMPHLPLWRLRDTVTHLQSGVDLVIGSGEQGDWYLIGLRSPHPALLRNLPLSGAAPDDLCIAAATHGLRVEQLPPWYTLRTMSDLNRLADDLRTMPRDVAPQTRIFLTTSGLHSRVVGE
ncbi:hypothetical protein OSCT_2723 [Oscillochloris trichoides DG-6]|uniref:Glycosyltransferase n=1 Tax=Oscillochloris trichoides DG-6 TaxID=765420 RepID=E1IHC2_9CHLR|nr:DUF2064 domain-containing protein [Oscillochloris trichoides]EFO79375.1 hypothetical protein OSCT_2723 [Oscillochloris trichoides DG-6]